MKAGIGDIKEPMTSGAKKNSPRKIQGFFCAQGRVTNQIAILFRNQVWRSA